MELGLRWIIHLCYSRQPPPGDGRCCITLPLINTILIAGATNENQRAMHMNPISKNTTNW